MRNTNCYIPIVLKILTRYPKKQITLQYVMNNPKSWA